MPDMFIMLEEGYNKYSKWEQKKCKYESTSYALTAGYYFSVSDVCMTCSQISTAERAHFPLSEQ